MLPRLKVSPRVYVVFVLVVFWGTILIAMASGLWTTKVATVPTNQPVSAEQVETDIKGWMTFEEVSSHTEVSVKDLYTLAGVPADMSPTTSLKDAAAEYEFSMDDFKTKLQDFMITVPKAP